MYQKRTVSHLFSSRKLSSHLVSLPKVSKHHLDFLFQVLKSKQVTCAPDALVVFFWNTLCIFVIVSSVKTHTMDTLYQEEVAQLPKEPAPSSDHQLKLVEMNPTYSHCFFLGSSKVPVISCSCCASSLVSMNATPRTVRYDPARLGSGDYSHSFPAARKHVIT